MNLIKQIPLFIFSTILFASCSSSKNSGNTSSSGSMAEVLDREWKLTEVQGTKVPQTSRAAITLTKDFSVFGSTGCNRMNGTFESGNNQGLTFKPLATTRMACMDETINEVERKFLEAIHTTTSWKMDGDALLFMNNKKVVARFAVQDATARLNGEWELTFISGARITFDGLYPKKKPTMKFAFPDSSVSGNSSCNSYNFPVEIKDSSISFGDGLTTMMACEGDGETVYFQTLKKVNKYSLSEDGQTLTYYLNEVPMMRFEKK